ncbi:response regulator transcription factor [Rickettsiales endosymbiont of Peranema trichophorum]|uniref:response regulator transcription factor n=1 Tax=Rickettsiales endosymbiont of Peranema trichophorum TaxID=2486577 RepID=UPI00102341D0|nr:response regulator transcription factor [Rickettsiales endosymbiont of Peranema trichophorum]RZI47396.1 response regulator transcription factor [Rickettsiales endosymbiont of Peranema trichophorum]
MKVLIIESDSAIAKSLQMLMGNDNICSDIALSGEDGTIAIHINRYDLIVLEWMLEDMSGCDILLKLRRNDTTTPVLVISALDTTDQKIKALTYGADDYVTKPFNTEELLARIKAIVRRAKGHATSLIKVANLAIDTDSHTTSIEGVQAPLTNKEQVLLEFMALRKGSIISKETFLSHLYNGMDEPDLKIIDVFICKMRKKLFHLSGGLNYIETVWGRGYSLKEPKDFYQKQMLVQNYHTSSC